MYLWLRKQKLEINVRVLGQISAPVVGKLNFRPILKSGPVSRQVHLYKAEKNLEYWRKSVFDSCEKCYKNVTTF